VSERNGHAEAAALEVAELAAGLLGAVESAGKNTSDLLTPEWCGGMAELLSRDRTAYLRVRSQVQEAGHKVRGLDAAVKDQLAKQRRAAKEDPGPHGLHGLHGLYTVEGGRICRTVFDREGGSHAEPLCNFSCRIVREEVVDDGSGETRHTFAVEGALPDGTRLPSASVPAGDFALMNWPLKEWGLSAVVFAGSGTKDHLRVAIQELSAGAERHRVYKHTGWRQDGDTWLYLHAGGAAGAKGTVRSLRVDLDGALARYHLPDPPQGAGLKEAARADLRLLEVSRPSLTYPLLGAVYRSVLGPADCSLSLVGATGLGKSELAALAQQHFGAEMHRLNLPANWSSTANALEGLAFLAKDALLVIDDFKPGGGRYETDQLHVKADRVLRAQGNRSGRQRCWADGTVRADRPPRGLILITGEDQVRGESLRARNLPLLVRKGDVNVRLLTPYQRDAAGGLYAQSLAGFLKWAAPRYADIRQGLPEELAGLRERAQGDASHPRTPGIVADLFLGLSYFLDFAVAAKALKRRDRDQLAADGWVALLEAAADQTREVLAQDPARRFLELIAAAVTSERAHLANRYGGEPADPGAWGWRVREFMTRDGPDRRCEEQGRLIGWVDGGDVYLDADAAYAEAQRLADDQGERLPLSKQQLCRRLKEEGLLAATDPDRATVRRTLQGRDRAVIYLRPGALPPLGKPYKPCKTGDG
jgi:hypothetical protein